MFLSRNKKKNVYPCKPQFYYTKVGFKGVSIIWACFCDGMKVFAADLGLMIKMAPMSIYGKNPMKISSQD